MTWQQQIAFRKWLIGHWLDRKIEEFYAWRARHMSKRFRNAALVRLAVDATTEELIGPHAYAGPDGIDYERMWWAIRGELPPGRAEAIRAPCPE